MELPDLLTYQAKEFKIVAVREISVSADLKLCDTPDKAAGYWREAVPQHPFFNPEVECFVTLLLNTRRRIKGHCFISTGTLDTLLVHPREVFRPAIIAAASPIILMHNHPSGDCTPSEADIKVTRNLIVAGQHLQMDVLDHVIMGQATYDRPRDYTSLNELGFFNL